MTTVGNLVVNLYTCWLLAAVYRFGTVEHLARADLWYEYPHSSRESPAVDRHAAKTIIRMQYGMMCAGIVCFLRHRLLSLPQ